MVEFGTPETAFVLECHGPASLREIVSPECSATFLFSEIEGSTRNRMTR